jgi:undecaprenyl-diphosphatase
MIETIRNLDHRIFYAINNLAGKSHLLDVLGLFFANTFLYVFIVIIALLWFFKRLRPYVYLAFGSALVSRLIIVQALKVIFNHPRPYEILTQIHQLLPDGEHGMSFPSGHAVVYFSFALAFWGTEYFWPFFIGATLGSLARVFVGVHFPGDVLASFFIAWLTVWLLRRLFKNRILS